MRSIRIQVENCGLVSGQEFLLKSWRVDHSWAIVADFSELAFSHAWVQGGIGSRPHFNIDKVVPLEGLGIGHLLAWNLLRVLPAIIDNSLEHLVEANWVSMLEPWLNLKSFDCSGDHCSLGFDSRVHLSHCVENSTREQVLIIELEPVSKYSCYVGLKNLLDVDVTELLVLKDRVSFGGLRSVAKSRTVRSLSHLLLKVILRIGHLEFFQHVFTDTFSSTFRFEAFLTLHVDNRLDHSQALNNDLEFQLNLPSCALLREFGST